MGSGIRKMCKTREPLLSPDVDGVGKGCNEEEQEEEDEALLLPSQGGEGGRDEEDNGMVKRKVQWNDDKGNKLVEVLEFEPSGGWLDNLLVKQVHKDEKERAFRDFSSSVKMNSGSGRESY